jgi:hypothetical protein
MTDRLLGRTIVIVLPISWWLVQYSFASQFRDWNNDPAFLDAYLLPRLFFEWLETRTGWWGGQSYWVASQDALIGLFLALATALLLVRRDTWKGREAIRGSVAFASVLLPWQPFLVYSPLPEYHRVGGYAVCAAYALAAMGALILPLGRPIRIALVLTTVTLGVWFAILRFYGWDWDYFASLLAPLGLLLLSAWRLARNESVV